MTKDELILKWVNKKSEVTHEIYKMVKPNEIKMANLLTEHLNQIFDIFIEDLKNLPNELRAVNRNEAEKEFCIITEENIKRWFQLLVGKGSNEMFKDIRKTVSAVR